MHETFYHNGGVIEYWHSSEIPHRLDGPAAIFYDNNGNIYRKEWWQDGFLFNNGEATVHEITDENNKYVIRKYHLVCNEKCISRYGLLGKSTYLHNEDGPAVVVEYANNKIFFEAYYMNGMLHREDGPAVRNINVYSDYSTGVWYMNDEIITNVSKWIEENNYSIPLTDEQKMHFLLTFS